MGDEEESYHIVPPDKGWSWVVVIAACLTQFVTDGVFYCFTTFYEEIAAEFNTTTGTISTTYSFVSLFYFSSGIPGVVLLNIFQFRCLGMLAGILASGGFVLTALFCKSSVVLYILQGVMCGLGLGFSYFTGTIVCTYYFKKYKALAVGIGASGTGMGQIAVPPIIDYVRRNMGWRKSYYIMASILFIDVILAITYLPLEPVIITDTETKSKPVKKGCSCMIDKRLKEKAKPGDTIGDKISKVINYRLLKSPAFLTYLLSGFILNGEYTCFTYNVVQRGKWMGISESDSVYILSAFGAMNSVGRIAFGALQIKNYLDSCILSAILITCTGILGVIAACPFAATPLTQYLLAGGTALIFGPYSMRAVVAVELFGLENVQNVFGLNLLAMAMGVFSMNAIYSKVADLYGYFVVFAINLGLAIAVSILYLLLKPIRRWEKKRGILLQTMEDE